MTTAAPDSSPTTDTCHTCFAHAVRSGTCGACGADQAEPDRDRRALPAGTLVNGKYQLGRVLGSGGFGITYLAQDVHLARRVALKEFFPSGLVVRSADRCKLTCNSTDDEAPFRRGLDRFLREGQILAKFDHPNIVRVYEVAQANGTAYLAMEYLDGMTLKSWLGQAGGRLAPRQALDVMTFVFDALKVVHGAGVVHRDLKPDNVYLTRQGRTLLLDFGGAKQLTAEGDKSMDAMFAHGYAAPEQYFADTSKVGPWTDVYACGATLFKLLTGQTVRSAMDRYTDDPALDWERTDASPAVRHAIEKALALRHGERYQSVGDFHAALLDEAVVPPPLPSPPPSPPSPLRVEPGPATPTPDRSRRMLLVGAGAGVVVVSLATLALWPRRGNYTSPPSPVPSPTVATSAPAPVPASAPPAVASAPARRASAVPEPSPSAPSAASKSRPPMPAAQTPRPPAPSPRPPQERAAPKPRGGDLDSAMPTQH